MLLSDLVEPFFVSGKSRIFGENQMNPDSLNPPNEMYPSNLVCDQLHGNRKPRLLLLFFKKNHF